MTLRLRFAMALFAALFLISAGRPAAAQGTPHVYLMRGLANVFSYGLDDLAAKLNARGIPAVVYEYGQWQQLADQASAVSRSERGSPIIIVGHSLGADAAIEAAERLTALGTPARLVITFDPVGVSTVGPAAGKFVNYYQSNNGYGKRLTAGPGFRGNLFNRNLDAMAAIDHFNIEKSPVLHSEVVASVQALKARPKPKPKPAAPALTPASQATAPTAPGPGPSERAATATGQKAM
ncbi:thioesterase domain-containing protein [Xanthobacter sp. V4C-4]|uniref:hypothetical protein n=1 Tax=Xanthobacter cornucopiae TaxID=3119924 RepID=UPI00372CACDE